MYTFSVSLCLPVSFLMLYVSLLLSVLTRTQQGHYIIYSRLFAWTLKLLCFSALPTDAYVSYYAKKSCLQLMCVNCLFLV